MSHLIARVSTSSSQNLVSEPTSASPVNADDASNHAQVNLTIIFGIIASVLALAALVVGYLQFRKYKRPSQDQGASQPSEVWDLLEVHTHTRRQTWQRSGNTSRDTSNDRERSSRMLC